MAKDYNITRTAGLCVACETQLQPEQEYVATVREPRDGEEAEGFVREDFCPACWDAAEEARKAEPFGVWRTHVPKPTEKKKLFVDDDVLINFFERLDGAEEPAKVSFRYVLALVLMRKKLLVYDRSGKDDAGRDVWRMHFKGSDRKHEVTDPNMDEDQIAEVSQQLGQILQGEL